MTGISCTAATACVATGYAELPGAADNNTFIETLSGSTWTPTTSGFDPIGKGSLTFVYLFGVSCTSTTSCVAGGEWEGADFVEHFLVATLSGSTWTPSTPSDVPGADSGITNGISCAAGSTCITAGTSWVSYPSGASSAAVDSLSGGTWSPTTGINPAGPPAAALNDVSCVDAADCVAVGYDENAPSGFNQIPLTGVLTGSGWTLTSLPEPSGAVTAQLYSVSCTAVAACVAVGIDQDSSNAPHLFAETLSGSTWTASAPAIPSGGTSPSLSAVTCTAATTCVAVGAYTDSSSQQHPLVETLSGSSWTATSVAAPSGSTGVALSGLSCTGPTACVAVGFFDDSDFNAHSLVETLSGSVWAAAQLADPVGASYPGLTGVSCISAIACLATGYYDDTNGDAQGFAEALSGSTWTESNLAAPSGSTSTIVQGRVSCTGTGTAACVTVGNYIDAAGVTHSLIETRTGSTWSATTPSDPSGATLGSLYGVSCPSSSACVAVGLFQPATGGFVPLAATLSAPSDPVTHFSVALPGSATAGTAVIATVTALDAGDATVAGYAGTVHFTSSDGQAVLPANATLTSGSGSFSVTLKTAGSKTVTATDTVTAGIAGTSASVTVSPAAVASLAVSAPATGTAGTASSVTVTAVDAYGNTVTGYAGTVHFTSSDGQAVLPANATLTSGTATFDVTLKTAGAQTVAATDTVIPGITGISSSVTVSPAGVALFVVTAPGAATAGTAIGVTVTARDIYGNIATGYSGTVHLTSSDGQAVLPVNATLTAGTRVFNVALKTAGPQTVTAIDTITPGIAGTSSTVTVSAAAATSFAVTAPGAATAGTASSVTVTATDAYGNTVTGYSGTVHFTSSDGQAVLPANATLTNGTATFDATLKTAGSQTVTATDTVTSGITGTSSSVTVTPSAATSFSVSAPGTAAAGTPSSVTVTAKDAYGNVDTAYAGTVHLTSSDPRAVLPDDATLTAGTGTFNVTLKTAGPQTVTATDTVTPGITGTSSSVAVNPSAATSFTVTAPATATAGTAISVTVTAEDRYGNTVTGYSGTVHLTSSDGQAALAANATLTNGTGTFNVTLKTAGPQTVTATDTVTPGIHGVSGAVTVNPAAASSLTVTAPASATAGAPIDATVTAIDRYGNTATAYTGTIHFTSNDSQAVLPADVALTAGAGSFAVILKTAGSHTVTATDTVTVVITGTSSAVTVSPAVAASFTVSAPGIATAGTGFDVTVTAKDGYGNVATAYSGTVHLTSSDGQAGLPADATLTAGTGTLAVNLRTAGAQTVTATDTVTAGISGISGTITVGPAAVASFAVSAPSTATAGTASGVTVTAMDAYGNTVTGYAGTVHVTSSDGQAALPPNATLTNGTATFDVTLQTAGAQTVTATDTVIPGITGTSSSVTVNPAGAALFVVTAPGTATAGTAISVTVTARDAYGNVATGYAGTVHFASTDTQAALPADITLTAGTGGFTVTLRTAGAQTVSSTDTVEAGITGITGTITVRPAAAASFTVSTPGAATAGGAVSVTVTAIDAYGNTVTGYTDAVHLTSSDGQAVLPANATLTNGTGTFDVTLKTAGSQRVTAADATDAGISGASDPVAVSAVAATSLAISAPTTAIPGIAITVTVTAIDLYGNTAVGYTGTIGFTSSDAQATLPGVYSFTGLDAGVHAFSVTFATSGSETATVADTGTSAITGTSNRIAVAATGPSAPQSVTAIAPSDHFLVDGVVVSWAPPSFDGGGALTGYTVVPDDLTTGVVGPSVPAGPGATSSTVTGLTAGDLYSFTVAAETSLAPGPASASSNQVVPVNQTPATSNSVTSTNPSGSAIASVGTHGTPGSLTATGTGSGTVTVSKYTTSPVAGIKAGASYYDVSIAPGSSFTELQFTVCGVSGSQGVLWWNPVAQANQRVSSQTLPTGSGSCATVTVTAATSPNLSQMVGTAITVPPESGYTLSGSDGGIFAFGDSRDLGSTTGQIVGTATTPDGAGYWQAASDGGVFAFGDAGYFGSMGGMTLGAPIVAMAVTPDGRGYWLVGADGGVFAFGDAAFFGSNANQGTNDSIIQIVVTPSGGGYWLLASDGGVFAFGDAQFYGSMGGQPSNAPTRQMAVTPDGLGYWLVASDGGVFAFGDASFWGSATSDHLAEPIVGITAAPGGQGYWLVGADGGVFSYGDAPFYGSASGLSLNAAVVDLTLTADGQGYWLLASDGGVFAYGDAPFYGSMAGTPLQAPILNLHPAG